MSPSHSSLDIGNATAVVKRRLKEAHMKAFFSLALLLVSSGAWAQIITEPKELISTCIASCQKGETGLNSSVNSRPTRSECTSACKCLHTFDFSRPGDIVSKQAARLDFCRKETWPHAFGPKPDTNPTPGAYVMICRYGPDLVEPIRDDYKVEWKAQWDALDREIEQLKKTASIRNFKGSLNMDRNSMNIMNDMLVLSINEYRPPPPGTPPKKRLIGTNQAVMGPRAKCLGQQMEGVIYRLDDWLANYGLTPASIKQYGTTK